MFGGPFKPVSGGGNPMNPSIPQSTQISPAAPAGLRPYTLPIEDGRIAYLYAPADLSTGDFELLDDGMKLIRRSVAKDTKPQFVELRPPDDFQTGQALWT